MGMNSDIASGSNSNTNIKDPVEEIMKSHFNSASAVYSDSQALQGEDIITADISRQIEESQQMIMALTADYLAVYMIDPIADRAEVLKLDKVIKNRVDTIPESFSYSRMFKAYAENRIFAEDRESFLNAVMPEALIRMFSSGRAKYELNYRIFADGEQKYYSGLFIRISKPEEPLKLIVGFRNIDDVIDIQKQTRNEGLYSAYTAVSDAYLSMHRVNVKKNTYSAIKTTDAIIRHTIPGSNRYDENVQSIIKGLAKEESYKLAMEFLDITTLNERMKGRIHLTTRFEGRIAGTCRLHFFKENDDAAGNLEHVIFAVEVTDEDKYQSVFDVLARGFQNVFWINPKDGAARILKLDGYITKGLEKENHKYNSFPYSVLLKQYIKDRVYEEDQQYLYDKLNIDKLREVFADRDEYIGNYRVQIDGRMHHYQYSYVRISNTDYLVAGFQNIDSIIEEHIEAEKKEKAKEEAHQREIAKSYQKLEEMHDIFAASKMGVWNIYLLDGRAPSMEADEQMRELLGIAGKALTDEEVYDAWFENVTPGAVQTVLNCVENMKNGGRDEITYLWKHPVLGERYVRCGGTARKTPDGYVLSGYHYDVDDNIREQKKKDEALRRQQEANQKEEQEHAEVISSLSTIYSTIFRADLDTHHYEVLTSVPLMGNVAGAVGRFDDVKEAIINAFMSEEHKAAMREFLDINTLSERLQGINTVATEYRNPDGRWFQARFIVKRRDEQGAVHEVLYVARDYTDEKEKELSQKRQLAQALEAAQQASKAKSTFLNSMSHDIRTPMNAIIGFTSLAQAHITEQKQVQDYLTKISTSGTHLLNLINDILDMSRIESGTVKLEEKPVHLPDFLKDLCTMIQGLVNAKNQSLIINMQDVIHEDVITDKLRLNQVLINIVGNAVKFTPSGGEIIVGLIEKNCSLNDCATYEFSVKDNGIGMSQEFIGHIFDTFSREHNSTVSGIQGTGLGMAITKNIVDMMGGDIQVESEEGKGSVFRVTINMRLAEEPVADEAAIQEAAAKNHDYSGKRVLLVEDNELNREIATAILEEMGMVVASVGDGDEAVAAIVNAEADKYDLVLMDIQMPKMDGYTATREIRTLRDNRKANIPIVAMTANAFYEDRQRAFASGMNGHIIKPISIKGIAEALDTIFAGTT